MGRAPKNKLAQNGKCCPQCGRTLPFTQFYPNKDWSKQIYRDLWCKDCAVREAVDVPALKKYFYENNRVWDDRLLEASVKRAEAALAVNEEYVNCKSDRKKEQMRWEITVKYFFGQMNLASFYAFVDNAVISDAAKVVIGDGTQNDPESRKMAYSTKWRGYYTPEQIEILEETYARFDQDFDQSDVAMTDYAKKGCKASLHCDIVYDKMRRNEATLAEYRDANKVYDDLMKSANFAACKRKPGDQQGFGSQGEIILRIEGTGKLNVKGEEWEPDSIDKVIQEYRHVLTAIGKEGLS